MKLSRLLSSSSPSLGDKPLWRESASLLLAAPIQKPEREKREQTLSYLMMTRSKKSKFMPGGIVFPGGTISPIDSNTSHWTKLYDKLGLNLEQIHSQLLSPKAKRPNIYTDRSAERVQAGLLPQEITLRITAIREAFEECGVLLLRKPNKSGVTDNSDPSEPEKLFKMVGESELINWQKKVRGNPDEFLSLCEHLSVVPDLSRLYEWSNWLTPNNFKYSQRFDTMFYMAILPKPVPLLVDPHEAEGADWSTVTSLLEKHASGEHKLMPPQFYEMFRLQNTHSAEDLQKLMEFRRQAGIERWFPHIIETKNGFVSILPGDELYPENPEPNLREQRQPKKYDQTVEELSTNSKKKHRFRFLLGEGLGFIGADISIPARYGHIYNN